MRKKNGDGLLGVVFAWEYVVVDVKFQANVLMLRRRRIHTKRAFEQYLVSLALPYTQRYQINDHTNLN